MEPLREIVIGVDLDPEGALTAGSQMAVRQGLAIARAMDGAVTLLHANAADEYWDEEAGRFLCDDAGLSEERERALAIVRGLSAAVAAFRGGQRSVEQLRSAARAIRWAVASPRRGAVPASTRSMKSIRGSSSAGWSSKTMKWL